MQIYKKILCLAAMIFFVAGCGIFKKVQPVETHTEINWKDSTVIHVVDSIRIIEATRYRDMAWLQDTLRIEGNRSRMWAYADTLRESVIGELEEDRVEEKIRIVEREKIVRKDSLVYRDVPVPVEVEKKVTPKWSWYSLVANLLFLIGAILFIRFR